MKLVDTISGVKIAQDGNTMIWCYHDIKFFTVIGIWYAIFSIKYIINIADDSISCYQLEERTWIIYESIKIGIIGLSLIIFGISCRWYRYCERDEVVNIQGIFEKELLQQENEDENASLASSQTNYSTFDCL